MDQMKRDPNDAGVTRDLEKARVAKRRASKRKKSMRQQIAEDHGLVRVRGNVSGETYYE